jgi:predicted metal-dependent hydrolase
LFGEVFQVRSSPEQKRAVDIDHDAKMVRSGRNLLEASERKRWQRAFARNYLIRRVNELASAKGFNCRRVFVRSQRTRWGTCSSKHNISLNWRLITAPKDVIDYVILHELLHTKIQNHSHRFWVHLSAISPGFREAIAWLIAHKPIA